MTTPPFVPYLINWMNWLIPDEPEITSIGDFIGTKKLQKAFEKILPKDVLPQPDDSLVYIYTIITSLVKLHNKGTDIFKNPVKFQNNQMNAIFILLELFIYYAINLEDEVPKDSDSWYPQMMKIYNNFCTKNQSTITEFPFQTYTSKAEEDNEEACKELNKLRKEYEEKKESMQKKLDSLMETHQPKIDENIRTLALLEKKKKKQIDSINEEDSRKTKILEEHEVIKEAEMKYNEQKKKNEELEALLCSKREEEKLLNKAKLELEVTENGDKQRFKIMSVSSEINSLLEEERIIEERIKELEEEYGTETGEPVARKECDISSYEEQIKKYEEEREEINIEEKKQNWISLINEEIEKAENETKALGTVCDLGQTYIRESKQK